jgi:hypothetical protein
MPDITLTLDPETGSFPPATGLKPGVNYTIILEVEEPFEFSILLQIDVDEPAAKDDELILLDESGTEVEKIAVKDMVEVSRDMVRLVFKKAQKDKKYSLIRDYGAEDDGGHDPLFIKLTYDELMKYTHGSGDAES